ncbi:cadherin-24-like isoform X2 [Xiphophorus maculatus]|uniref:Cadherin 24 n=1 Tax=Xiphophorus maculatus TaxID=8083 RepID=A0A3B5Q1W3_XIPMA|nr:cadherin-24-like isoform X2 [Xiphophorus maculatus]
MIRERLAAAPHLALLFLFLCRGEGCGVPEASGLSEEDEDMRATPSEKQQVLPHPESAGVLLDRIKEPGRHGCDAEADVTPIPSLAFQPLGANHPVDKRDTLSRHETSAASFMSKLRTEVTEMGSKTSGLSNGDDGGVIDGDSLGPSSEEEAYSVNGVGEVPPGRTRGGSERVEDPQSGPRRRRSWLWNQFFVIEEYRGPEPVLIGRLHTDVDRGDGRTKYMLEGEGVGSVFVIDGNTGNIHVTKALDREEKDEYRLTATATDRETGQALEPSSEFIIRVQDINDNPPIFPDEPYVAVVPEMANIGTSITRVTATDADDPTYGNSARLVYGILQGQDQFSVDPQTGILRTAVPDMDRETQDEYLVVLQAKDMGGHLGGLTGTTTVTVKLSDVNDNPPHFRRSAWSFSVSELAAPGVEVGRLTATDPDLGENAQLEFAILDAEEADIFNVTGRAREAVIVLNKLLDYEMRNSYTFSVEVANPVVDPRFIRKGPFKDQATVRVMILNADEPPRFSQAVYHLDVSENCPPLCAVGRVHAVDPDTGQSSNIRYSIDPQSDPEALFRIASDKGFISAVVELDREQEQWHNISVIATQRDNPNLVSRAVVAIETLDQNDNAPELDRQYATSVCDSSAPGQVVQVLRAVDRDQGGQDSPVHFSIPPESSSALNLSIRESGGVTASLVLQSALEPLPGFSSSPLALDVPVVLRDGASGLTNTGTVTVTICPCLQGGMQTENRGRQRDPRWERHVVCLPAPTASPSLIFSLVTLLAMLACVTTLLVVCALSLSLRHQKRDSHSPFEEDDVRENIISYDDEGGGEADTAAFDIAALQSMHRIQHMHNSGNIWYTQQNPPRARTYSWSRHPRPALGPQQRPGSAPLYGRLCYGVHTLPVLRDYPLGPLEAGLQLGRVTQGLTAGHGGANRLLVPGRSTFEPLLHSPEMSLGGFEAEHMLAKSAAADGNESGGSNAAGAKGKEEQAKPNPTGPESTAANGPADLTYESSCQSHTSFSSNQQDGRPGSSQTQVSTGATSTTADDIDTDSSIRSMSEQNYSTSSQMSSVNSPAYVKADSYSIVGSLNPGGMGVCINGTGAGGGLQLLNMATLKARDTSPQTLTAPAGSLGNGKAPASEAPNPQPLRMEELLNIRLDRVTSDLSQPPYDSLQTYEFEGRDSRAESLSSLESDGDKEGERAAGGGMDELNQKFQRLVEIIRERQKEKKKTTTTQSGEAAETSETQRQGENTEKQQQRWDF